MNKGLEVLAALVVAVGGFYLIAFLLFVVLYLISPDAAKNFGGLFK